MLFENVVKSFLVLGALSLSASLSGCGGSGGGSGGTTPTPTPTPGPASTPTPTPTPITGSGSYLFYLGSNSGSSTITAVDPAAPASPITVEAGTTLSSWSIPTFWAGSYDAATKTFNDFHNYAIAYAKTDGKIYKASALKSSGAPTPTQLSSEMAADKICSYERGSQDFANPDNSQMIYSTPGPNATCGNSDDVYKMVRLGMGATDTPVAAKKPVSALLDLTTAALSGWLVNDAGALKRCDVNFANCGASLKPITSYVNEELSYGDLILLNIDNKLFVYDGNTNTLSAAIYTLGGINSYVNTVVKDASKFYFSTGNAPKSIYTAPADGSAAATPLITDADDIVNLKTSSGKLLYSTATGIKAVAKTGGAASMLVNGGAFVFNTNVSSGNRIYYQKTVSGVPTAGVIDDDGSNKSETANAQWQGVDFGTSLNFSDVLPPIQIQTIIRAEGYDALGAGKGFAGGTLRAFAAASKTEVGVLGTVPTDITDIGCGAYGANMLCDGSNSTQTDVFFMNAETPGSLVRVTNTPTQSENAYF